MDRLRHDVAFAAANACTDAVASKLPPAKRGQVFEVFYKAFRAALEKYDAMRELQTARLKPSRN